MSDEGILKKRTSQNFVKIWEESCYHLNIKCPINIKCPMETHVFEHFVTSW